MRRGSRMALAAVTAMTSAVAFTIPAGSAQAVDDGAAKVPPAAPALVPRVPPGKPAEVTVPPSSSPDRLHVKFREGSAVRLRAGRFATLGGDDLGGLRAALGAVPGVRAERLVTEPEASVTEAKAEAEQRSLRVQADFNLWYRLRLPAGADAVGLLDALNDLDLVEIAYAEPLPAPLPSPSFAEQQGYFFGAPNGIGSNNVSLRPGATGGRVRIIDIEYSWNTAHEDLDKTRLAGAVIANGTPSDPFNDNNHGTAVLGELISDSDFQGVTGLVGAAGIGLVNAFNTAGYNLTDAINIARNSTVAGDVILLEQQTAGANGGCGQSQVGCVAVEWVPAFYDAIALATGQGRIVVEAAGNGSQDLDGAEYGRPFPGGRPDSGAIIVGAGAAPGCTGLDPRSRLNFSTFGTRVDLQGWGQCVVTTGYGDLHNEDGTNALYTQNFGGTSSASPIVASAAATVSSVHEQATGRNLTPRQIRSRLIATGTPQDFSTAGEIGPLPDLVRAIALPNDAFSSATAISGASGSRTGTNIAATKEGGEPAHGGNAGGGSIWYRWTAPASGRVSFSTAFSDFDTLLGAYTGASVSSLTVRASNDDSGGSLQSAITFPVTSGTTYRIAVDGYNTAVGSSVLSWRLNRNPVARAGADFQVNANAAFFIDARSSTDPEGNPLTFRWVQVSGPAVRIESPTSARTRVSGSHARGTDMVFRVTVTDSAGNTATDEVKVHTK